MFESNLDVAKRISRYYTLIVVAFSALVVISPILGTKVIEVFGVKFTAGLFTILLGFSLLDIVNEIFGHKEARYLAVSVVLVRLVLFVVIVPIIIKMPSYLEPTGYSNLLYMGMRTFVASEILTLVQNVLIDIPIFNSLKKIKLGFFFRANLSNIISWSFGTICFVLISFWGYDRPLIPIMLGQTLVKFPLSFCFAWIGLLAVRRMRRLSDKAE